MEKRILFLCVANSARSQLAEAVAKSILGPDYQIQSAGSQPSGKVHPQALAALKEAGFETSGLYSKSIGALDSQFLNKLDVVITLCAEEVCPVMPGHVRRLHWPIADPASAPELSQPEAFLRVRQILEEKLLQFKNQI